MISSSLAILLSSEKRIVAADCDVDAPNLAVWLGEPENWQKTEKISVSEKPVIRSSGLSKEKIKECVGKCRFGALKEKNGELELSPFLCEGCGACEIFCPEGVAKMKPVKSGEIRIKKSKHGFPLVSGHLYPGETGSGKIVSEVKSRAENLGKEEIMIIDSAPGTGCPVTASLQDADLVLLITEPTPSSFSDLKRVLKVVEHFNIPWHGVINKWDVNQELSGRIEKWLGKRMLGKISYDKGIFKAVSQLIPIVETNLKAKKEIEQIFNNFVRII